MGCTSPTMVQSRRVVPLPPEAINSYIDKFPAIILLKLKEKFDSFAEKETKDLTPFNFLKLYSVAKLNTEMHRRLYAYFNDNQKSNIKFRQFILKYATIVKCEPSIFYHILFELYKNSFERDFMNEEEFVNFMKNETQFFKQSSNVTEFPISLSRFIDLLKDGQFRAEEYQMRLVITTQEDIPFKLINLELENCDFNDFVPGSEYYLISNAWFYRWSFYYQEADHNMDKEHIKSTKALPDGKSSFFGKRYKRKGSTVPVRKLSESLRSSDLGNTLVEQPKTIDFDDIEGQYRGQLKESLKISAQIKIISENLWKLLCSLHPADQSFKRVAINEDTLEYYPKAIYYFEADSKGEIKIEGQQIKYFSVSQKAQVLLNGKNPYIAGIFSKNFGQKNWRQVQNSQSFSQISLDPRFLIVVAENRQKFIEKAFRKEIGKDNLQPGDNIYAHFTYVKQHSQAWIVGIGKQDLFKIHFKGYSYRYEIEIKRQEISVVEAEAALSSAKKRNESIIKGIPNIGNTCFMNSIIQCLVSTPVLDNFLIEYPFNEKKEPIGYGLSMMAKSLMKNEKPTPQQFKRLIDVHMPLFSGYDQHDAQQFLNLLLDKLNDEIIEKPTVIDYLFAGKIKSKLTCTACKCLKNIEEKMYILSLPIPQPQFNYFSIIIVPISSKTLKKLVVKLPRTAVVADYCKSFEERTGENRKDFLFVETSFNSLKKVKQQIMQPNLQSKLITDVGIVPSVPLLAFQKLPAKFYSEQASKCKSEFREFQPKPQAAWTICRVISSKNEKNEMTVQYIQDNDVEKLSIDREAYKQSSAAIGTKSDLAYKKIILRRYNQTLKKMEQFGLELLVGIAKWSSYNDLIETTEKVIGNVKEKEAKIQDIDDPKTKGDYVIRFLETTKMKCIFCQCQVPLTGIEEKDLGYCCNIMEKDIPHPWISKSKMFWVYVDWIDFSKCKASYCTYLDMDQTSRTIELSRQDNQINLQACMNLHSKAEVVEMECDGCKEKYQNLEHLIGKMPNILVVHMKEFRYTPEGHLVKLDLRLKWQEFLDSSKYALTSSGKLYELFAVVRHSGSSQSGHYTCLAKRKHPFQNKKVWVHFDDDSTTIVRQQQKFVDDAYLLFYKKVDMPTSSLVIYSDLQP